MKFEYKPAVLGITDVIEMDYRGYGQGRIVSLGPDMKEKWRISGINPADIATLLVYLKKDRSASASDSSSVSEARIKALSRAMPPPTLLPLPAVRSW